VTDALIAMGHIVLTDQGGEVTPSGEAFLRAFGADVSAGRRSRRLFCQPCLDWSERRYHVKGVVGAAILGRLLELEWFKRAPGGRALVLTARGRAGLLDVFGIEFQEEAAPATSSVGRISLTASRNA
jgi:hypothetical protein